jgi:anti-anti-sigma factor
MDPHLVLAPLSRHTQEQDATARANGNGRERITGAHPGDPPRLAPVDTWRHTLVLRGELDYDSTLELREELTCLCEEGVTSVVLDLRELCFIDAQGAKAVATGGALCRRRGREMSVLSDSLNVERVLSQAGAGDMLSIPGIDGAGSPRSGVDHARTDLRTRTVRDL